MALALSMALVTADFALLAAPRVVAAQQAGTVYRIGFATVQPSSMMNEAGFQAFPPPPIPSRRIRPGRDSLSGTPGRSRDMIPERPRWVIVADVKRPETYPVLRRNFAGSAWVEVVVDRRRGERRQPRSQHPVGDRRVAGRRSTDRDPAQVPPFRLAHQGDGFAVYEATTPVPERCPQCGAMVSVEMPRFAEPPVRLELTVVHEPVQPDRARHVVELQSFSATGRLLLTSRLFVRTRTDTA
jgi:hypothetical protein